MPEAQEAVGALWPAAADEEVLTLKTSRHFTAEIKLVNTHFKQYKNVGGAKLFWAKFQFPLWRWREWENLGAARAGPSPEQAFLHQRWGEVICTKGLATWNRDGELTAGVNPPVILFQLLLNAFPL